MTSMISILLFAKPVLPPDRREIIRPSSRKRADDIRKLIIQEIGDYSWTVLDMADHLQITPRQSAFALNKLVHDGILDKRKMQTTSHFGKSLYFKSDCSRVDALKSIEDEYLQAIGDREITTDEAAMATETSLTTTRRNLLKMEKAGIITRIDNGKVSKTLWRRRNEKS